MISDTLLRNVQVRVLEADDWAALEILLQAFLNDGGESRLIGISFGLDEPRAIVTFTE